jgi:hypothetical protein
MPPRRKIPSKKKTPAKKVRRPPRLEARVADAIKLLTDAGLPMEAMTARRQRRMALALLAIANMTPRKAWTDAAIFEGEDSHHLTSRQIIDFWNTHYGENIASGSYDDIRRQELVVLVEAGIALRSAVDPNANPNDPTRGYAVSAEAGDLLKKFGETDWPDVLERFRQQAGVLRERLARRRSQAKVPVTLPSGERLELAPGPHNELQRSIIEEFLPRFVPDAVVLYVGDAEDKILHIEEDTLKRLGFFELAHDALPDVVAYDERNNWILLVEAVHSSNPISALRHLMLERMTKTCLAPRVYVSAFKDRKSFRKWLLEISWETEVWLADTADHLIHFNGDKFLGPHT